MAFPQRRLSGVAGHGGGNAIHVVLRRVPPRSSFHLPHRQPTGQRWRVGRREALDLLSAANARDPVFIRDPADTATGAGIPFSLSVIILPAGVVTGVWSGRVRTVPSEKTKVTLLTCPRTQDSVQSPLAVPETTALSTSGSSMPFAVRLSLPISTWNGYDRSRCR